MHEVGANNYSIACENTQPIFIGWVFSEMQRKAEEAHGERANLNACTAPLAKILSQ
ncbi:MAG: hypothetical protein IJA85_11640 [Clostridia bacterium]|nr:hypothetical protein [Clostridia bacterium]